jgi:hypothetical protein
MAVRALRGLVVLVAALGFTAPAHALSVLDNGRVRVGVDLERGGKIAWLSEAQGVLRPFPGSRLRVHARELALAARTCGGGP